MSDEERRAEYNRRVVALVALQTVELLSLMLAHADQSVALATEFGQDALVRSWTEQRGVVIAARQRALQAMECETAVSSDQQIA